ncbi:WXG100 family type VII secretion target [Cellulomonas soli]|uniref:Putative T7SS secretion signal domain-containing protein n=1 Tax=Cellulomonas soli TaxID=931535 RepID=A0A512PI62_9CELL|nr:hypothetical protein [Cellulomonas soli]NYI58719.1 uncharacterized protein YukE [Cellulomonas soli]GEP70898.1 hypothetical protein CSO01_36130 [Cellulomonas soli]
MTAPSEAELGTTDDPTALVPGSAGDIRGVAQTLRSWATRLADTGDQLRLLRAPTWTGEAADAFWAAFERVPAQWLTAADLLTEAAAALDSHADVITTTQSRAQDAIDTWMQAETLTAQSRAAHQAALAQYAQHGGIHPTYLDGGGATRQEAREILAGARQSLDTSGDEAVLALTRAGGGTYSTSGAEGPGTEGSWSWGSTTSDQWKSQWGKNGWAGLSGAPALGLSAVIASVHGSAWVWRAQGAFTTPAGGADGAFYGNGAVSALSADATGSVSWAAAKGFQAKLDAEANLVNAEGTVGYHNDYSDAHLSGTAQVGAYGQGEVTVTTDGVEAGGEVLAGARVSGVAEASVGGVGITGGVEGWAGAGAGAGATFTMEDGRWHIGANAGLAWGLGGSASVGIVIDPAEMVETGQALADEMATWW